MSEGIDAIIPLGEIIIKEISEWRKRKRENENDLKKKIHYAIDGIKIIVPIHVEYIFRIFSYAKEGDIKTASKAYNWLAYAQIAPTYDEIRGLFSRVATESPFKEKFFKNPNKNILQDVISALNNFYHAVFLLDEDMPPKNLEFPSHVLNNFFKEASNLIDEDPNKQALKYFNLYEFFNNLIKEIYKYHDINYTNNLPPIFTHENLKNLVTEWCKEWYNHVNYIYLGHDNRSGIFYLLGQLEGIV